MYGEANGLLDVLEHPSLRLMKPLPKRRRTVSPPTTATQVDEFVAHPTYDLLHHSLDPRAAQTIVNYVLDVADTTTGDGAGNGGSADDALDYGDHLHARGNKKKRKVPAALAGHVAGSRGDDPEGREDVTEPDPMGPDAPAVPETHEDLAAAAVCSPAQLRLSPAARAGLRRKAMVHERKQMLAAVLEREESLDPMTVEHALAASAPFMLLEDRPRVRSSRRIISRMARIAKDRSPVIGTVAAPSGSFDYLFASALSERLAADRRQVIRLHGRFQEELERQSAEAAKTAKQPVIAPKQVPTRAQPRSRPTPASTVDSSLADRPSTTSGGAKKKKKKRSALANASNPHHLRNYVPSRLPNSGPPNLTQASLEAQNLLSPIPLRFLNANLPRSAQSDDAPLDVASPGAGTAAPTDTSDEWICPFCEYNLFYGDDRAFQNALRSRKKVLRRRRRARERAAAAASGKPLAPKAAIASKPQEEEEDALFDPPHEDVPESITSQVKWNSRGARETDQRGGGGSG